MSRPQRDPAAQTAVAAQVAQQRGTCDNCSGLRRIPTPMCSREGSPHFRMVRDSYHERCAWFSVPGKQPTPPAEPPKPPSRKMKLVQVRGSNRLVTEEEYDRLMARRKRA